MKITKKEYMNNSSELHHEYHAQFVTEGTKRFILSSLSIEDIKKALESGDEHLNKIKIPYNNMSRGGGWWWDDAPMNVMLWKEANGYENKRILPSQATRTCVAKAAAKILTEQN